ncbi:MAG: DNA mismatch repair endonuclease MutL [Bacteriovoracaceae bacterium]
METTTPENTKHKIRLLPEHIIDQIKAGEIIERPSFVIKELLENSIDANATEIHITIIENGLKLIQIQDNGTGIDFNDLPYAFLRHATSKIETFEDVFKLQSFGFRGEALASIASIARVCCESVPNTNPNHGETNYCQWKN